MNKEIFVLYKAAFEEEDDPYLKSCLQDNFLEFFGYIPAFDEGSSRNWGGFLKKTYSILGIFIATGLIFRRWKNMSGTELPQTS
jgi:hypothetical protein